MTNIVSFLQKADEHSLVLFDELGAGTDPTEGAALAMSILSYLHQRKVRTLATTHYSELKVYALSTEGAINASCEFDVETLRPTYRLLVGIPGKSNAFAISWKLGLPDYIIEDAKNLIGKQDRSFEELITDLETNRITIEKEQEEIIQYKAEIEKLKKNFDRKNENLEASKERILKEAKEQAASILQEAKDFADGSIRKYNRWMSEGGSIKDMEAQRTILRERLSEDSKPPKKPASKPGKEVSLKAIKIGDSVFVRSLGLVGTITTLPNQKGDLFVQMGILNSQVNIKDLDLVEKDDTNPSGDKASMSGKIRMSKTATISPEINLIGKSIDEAIFDLDKYLDDAFLAHIPQVTVIHGRGTGALRNAVHSFLKKSKYVKEYRVGGYNEGNTGATIVIFK
jgi:DNA mismatch repair protein MutS2